MLQDGPAQRQGAGGVAVRDPPASRAAVRSGFRGRRSPGPSPRLVHGAAVGANHRAARLLPQLVRVVIPWLDVPRRTVLARFAASGSNRFSGHDYSDPVCPAGARRTWGASISISVAATRSMQRSARATWRPRSSSIAPAPASSRPRGSARGSRCESLTGPRPPGDRRSPPTCVPRGLHSASRAATPPPQRARPPARYRAARRLPRAGRRC